MPSLLIQETEGGYVSNSTIDDVFGFQENAKSVAVTLAELAQHSTMEADIQASAKIPLNNDGVYDVNIEVIWDEPSRTLINAPLAAQEAMKVASARILKRRVVLTEWEVALENGALFKGHRYPLDTRIVGYYETLKRANDAGILTENPLIRTSIISDTGTPVALLLADIDQLLETMFVAEIGLTNHQFQRLIDLKAATTLAEIAAI